MNVGVQSGYNVIVISTLIEAVRVSMHAADEYPISLTWLMNEGRSDFTGTPFGNFSFYSAFFVAKIACVGKVRGGRG
jgi:hypothetical protein